MLKYYHKEKQPKECKGCTACCHVLSIDEINKPFKTNCPNQCAIGCSIYEQRPKPCVEFECLFKQGEWGNEEQRPSTCGVMFTGFKDNLGDIISAWELWEGAFKNNEEYLQEISKIEVLVLRHYNGKISFKGRKEKVREFILLRGNKWSS